MNDPIETEQWLALNAYLCFCGSWGAFEGARMIYWRLGIYADEMFYIGFTLAIIGMILLALADFKVPTAIWRHVVRKAMRTQ